MAKLVIALILLSVAGPGLAQQNPDLDTLKKYSYLIIGASYQPRYPGEPPNNFTLHPEGYATGFFVNRNDSLLLVTAYHVLNMVDIYNGVKLNTKIDYLIVRYLDTTNHIKYHAFSISILKQLAQPCLFLKKADVDWVYVDGAFKDGKINTINDILLAKHHSYKKSTKVKFISYGFAAYEQTKYQAPSQYDDFVNPSYYEGDLADSSHYNPYYKINDIDSMYLTLTPKAWGGTSGSPVFRYVYRSKHKQWIEFGGIQSGANVHYDCAYVVKSPELFKLLGWKSN